MAAVAQVRPANRVATKLLVAVGCVALLLVLIAGVILYTQRAQSLSGLDLGRTPAPAFSLVDQDGQQISLAQFRGQPVAVTFLYTHCPDACPLIADEMRQAGDLLGPDASKVAMLAVSTDPRGDDRVSAVNFTQVHGLTGRRWHYLLGSPDQLSPIWQAYYIGVAPGNQAISEVIHSEAIFLIDKNGLERSLIGLPFSAKDLASDLRRLLSE
jgi:protein SCO1